MVDMGPWGKRSSTLRKTHPGACRKGRKHLRAKNWNSENNSDRSTTCDMVRGSSDVRNPQVGSTKVNWDHSESWVES